MKTPNFPYLILRFSNPKNDINGRVAGDQREILADKGILIRGGNNGDISMVADDVGITTVRALIQDYIDGHE